MSLKKMSDLKRRLVLALIVGILLIFLIRFSVHIAAQCATIVSLSFFACVALEEYRGLWKAKGLLLSRFSLLTASLATLLSFFFASMEKCSFWFFFATLFFSFLLLFLSHFRRQEKALSHLSAASFALVYIALPLSLMIGILYPLSFGKTFFEGQCWFAYLIVVTKMSDVGGYFIGRWLGQRALAPSLSPQKTIEGALGGLLASSLGGFLVLAVCRSFLHASFLSLSTCLYLSVGLGLMGQLGDLAESLLKRDAGVKDSGSLPGLGGVLDMLDSLLFSAPFLYLVMYKLG